MKRILLFVFAFALLSSAKAQLTSSTALTTGVTSYTNGRPNDPMFFYCAGQNGALTATPASGTPGWNFQWQSFSPTTSSWTNTTLESNVATSTITNLAPGAYRAIITDGTGAEVGRYIGWIMRVNTLPNINVNPIAPGCGSVNLSATFTAGTATPYYNIPPDPDPNSFLYIDANTEITVCYSGTHTNVSDLRFQIQAPSACGTNNIVVLALNPSPSNCNQGDNFTSLCFSTESTNVFNICSMTTPLTGTFGAYNTASGSVNIDWSSIYGCLANQAGWSIQILDCQGQNTGILQTASITFSGTSVGGAPTVVSYTGTSAAGQMVSGANNTPNGGFIFDNTCTATASTKYLVTNVAPPINLTQTYAWTANPPITITNSTALTATVNPGPIADTQFTLGLTGNFPVGICGFTGSDTELYDYTNSAVPVIGTVASNYCVGDAPFNLTASLTGGTWAGPGITNPSAGTFNPTTAGAGQHVVTYTLSGSCVTVVNTTINVWPTATPVISDPGVLCSGGSALNLTASLTGGTWTGTGITSSANGTFNPTTAGAGTWTVTYTLANTCNGTDTQQITVNSSSAVNITPVAPVCDNAPAFNLTASQTGGTWIGPGITSSVNGTFNPVTSGDGNFTITYDMNNICIQPATTQVQVLNTVNASITDPGILCPSAGIEILTANVGGGTWTGTGIVNANTGAFDPASVAANTYTITYTVPNTCNGTDTQVITVGSEASFSVTPVNNILCTGNAAITLAASQTGGTWSGVGITNASTGVFNPATAGAGDHVISYTIGTGCPVSESITIQVEASTDATISPIGDVCDTNPILFLTAAQGGGTWTGPGIVNASLGSFNPANAGFGSIVVTYTIAGACGSTDTEEINIISLDNLDITEVGPFCADAPAVQLVANITGGSWTGAGVSNTGLFTPASANSGSNTISYNLTGLCPATETTNIIVNALPQVNAGGNIDVCPGGSANITATGANSYDWTPTTYITGATNTATISVSPGATITYTVEGTSAAGCVNTDQITVVLNPAADITAAPAYQICEGGEVSLAVSGASTYSWTPTSTLFGPTSSAPIASPAVTTTYTVVGTDANGCTDSEQVTVTVVQIDVNINAVPLIGDLPLNVIFQGISNGDTFDWNFGEGTTEASSDITDVFEILYTSAGIYNASLTANLDGCSETASVEVIVLTGLPLLIPDVITPNGDGLNDVFTIRRGELETFNIDIYDRWGYKVGSINESADEWNPGDSDAGTYYYIMTGTTYARKEMVQEGSFILLNE